MKDKQQEKTKNASCGPTRSHWLDMNRKQRREMIRKIQSEDLRLEMVHPDAAGIDIGNESHYVAVRRRAGERASKTNCITSSTHTDTDSRPGTAASHVSYFATSIGRVNYSGSCNFPLMVKTASATDADVPGWPPPTDRV
jgi:hypothetical protein